MKCNLIFLIISAWVSWTDTTLIVGPKETVSGGEFVYYNLSSIDSYVHLILQSESGDCDLYVSEEDKYPTFMYYTVHSATCGLDTALIRRRSKGPVYIGIYGHPSFDTSECILEVCLIERPQHVDEFTDEVTEISGLSQVIGAVCQEGRTRSPSLFGRSLSTIAMFIHRIEIDGILLEIFSAIAQAVI